jgi:hypothetical protein
MLSVAALFVLLFASSAFAQTEPETPEEKEPLHNGFQISFYTGMTLNSYTGGYFGPCPCDFWNNAVSFSFPAGGALNIPLFEDAALLLRAGWHASETGFFSGRVDSLHSGPGTGDIGSDLTLEYSLVNVDLLLRLIGRMDGERVYVGPSFGLVQRKHVHLVDTEYDTGKQFPITDGNIEGGRNVRVSVVIGVEYAFTPLRNLFLIPAFEIDYSPNKISDIQPLRPTFYKLLLTIGYQVF